MAERMLKEDEAAELLGAAPKSLRCWRNKGYGPKFVKIGKPGAIKAAIRYRLSDIEAYMEDPQKNGIGAGEVTA